MIFRPCSAAFFGWSAIAVLLSRFFCDATLVLYCCLTEKVEQNWTSYELHISRMISFNSLVNGLKPNLINIENIH